MPRLYSLAKAVTVLRVNGHAPGRELLRYHAVRGHLIPDRIERTPEGQVIGYAFAAETLKTFARLYGWQYVGPDAGTVPDRL